MIPFVERLLLPYHRVIRFLISGSIAAVANFSTFFLVHRLSDAPHWYLVASACAFIVSFFVSFSMQKYWTFKERTLERIQTQLSISVFVAGGNLLINTLLMRLFVGHYGINPYIAQVGTAALIACETFFVYKHVIFSVSDPTPAKPLV